jgi:thiamine kinase-like enzyme
VAGLGEIVAQVERQLGPAAGPPVPLAGGITNRNFRVRFGTRGCVLRLTGARTDLLGVDRTAERLAGEAAAGLGVAPQILAAGAGYLVTEFLDQAPVSPSDLRESPEPVARALRAFHDSELSLPNRFWVPDLLGGYADVVRGRGARLPAAYGEARDLAGRVAAVLPLREPRPCHDDLLATNILAAPGHTQRVMLVDWEYAGMGHRMFDLGNLAVNNEFDAAAEDRLLEAYFGERPTPARRAALALMRIMSDAREAAWGVVQAVISELDFDFAGYARQHFARLAQAASNPRLQEWLDAVSE